ncbi:hypothetical protein [uncultured Gemmiger sp.]|uniref:hypothetical protein n=1 Tax=uncultured Gemmiger sp. TaxID=1623490 RepID=UPI0025F9F345|nr:hypothetical protein [uncultured Gemmiger sp.]
MGYSVLIRKIAERGIKKSAIAQAAGMSPRALNRKLSGKSPFTWPEALIIQHAFFPDIAKDELFRLENGQR